jgi:hypothetical protein
MKTKLNILIPLAALLLAACTTTAQVPPANSVEIKQRNAAGDDWLYRSVTPQPNSVLSFGADRVPGVITFGTGLALTGGTLSATAAGSSPWTQSGNNIYYNAGNVGIGTASPGADLSIQRAKSGSPVYFSVENTSNTAGSDGRFDVRAGGAAGGDPYVNLDISNVGGWSIGIDNSDADKLKFDTGSPPRPGSNTKVAFTKDGNVGIGTDSPAAALHVAAGQALFPDGSVVAGQSPGIAFSSYGNTGLGANNGNLALWINQKIATNITPSEFRMAADVRVGFSSAANNNQTTDTWFGRAAAGNLYTPGKFRVGGSDAAAWPLDVTGDINLTGDIRKNGVVWNPGGGGGGGGFPINGNYVSITNPGENELVFNSFSNNFFQLTSEGELFVGDPIGTGKIVFHGGDPASGVELTTSEWLRLSSGYKLTAAVGGIGSLDIDGNDQNVTLSDSVGHKLVLSTDVTIQSPDGIRLLAAGTAEFTTDTGFQNITMDNYTTSIRGGGLDGSTSILQLSDNILVGSVKTGASSRERLRIDTAQTLLYSPTPVMVSDNSNGPTVRQRLKTADPSESDDVVTKGYADSHYSGGGGFPVTGNGIILVNESWNKFEIQVHDGYGYFYVDGDIGKVHIGEPGAGGGGNDAYLELSSAYQSASGNPEARLFSTGIATIYADSDLTLEGWNSIKAISHSGPLRMGAGDAEATIEVNQGDFGTPVMGRVGLDSGGEIKLSTRDVDEVLQTRFYADMSETGIYGNKGSTQVSAKVQIIDDHVALRSPDPVVVRSGQAATSRQRVKIADPVDNDDAATKAYVDSKAGGPPVRALGTSAPINEIIYMVGSANSWTAPEVDYKNYILINLTPNAVAIFTINGLEAAYYLPAGKTAFLEVDGDGTLIFPMNSF